MAAGVFVICSAFISVSNSKIFLAASSCWLRRIDTCATSKVLLADANHDSYLWSNGATTQSITVNASGTYWWEGVDANNNKVSNGNFTAGNTGFTSSYTYKDTTGGGSPLQSEGTYSVAAIPKDGHQDWASFVDHTGNTTGNRYMMIVNGATIQNVVVWQTTVTGLTRNTDYIFSIWFTSVHPANPGQLKFSINNNALGDPIVLTSTLPDWKNFTVKWNSGNRTTATIGVTNQNTQPNGNDFAIDDVVFAPVCHNTYVVNLNSNPTQPTITPH